MLIAIADPMARSFRICGDPFRRNFKKPLVYWANVCYSVMGCSAVEHPSVPKTLK